MGQLTNQGMGNMQRSGKMLGGVQHQDQPMLRGGFQPQQANQGGGPQAMTGTLQQQNMARQYGGNPEQYGGSPGGLLGGPNNGGDVQSLLRGLLGGGQNQNPALGGALGNMAGPLGIHQNSELSGGMNRSPGKMPPQGNAGVGSAKTR